MTVAVAAAHAQTLFDSIPGDLAAVIRINNLERLNGRLVEFGRELNPSFAGIDLGEVERVLGFDEGTIDLSRPIHVLVSSPAQFRALASSRGLGDTAVEFPIVAFHPRNPAEFVRTANVNERRERRYKGPFGVYYLLARGDTIFAADSRRPLKELARLRSSDAMSQRMDPAVRRYMDEGDVSIHVPFSSWRQQLGPYMMIGTGLLRMGMTAEVQGDAERLRDAQKLANWAISGAEGAVDQVKSLTFSLTMDGESVRIDHRIAFEKGGSVTRYLGSVRRTGFAPWAGLPDRPFYLVGSWDWQVSSDEALAVKLNKLCLETDTVRKSCPGPTRERMAQYTRDCNAATMGTQFMITSPPGRISPMQFIGADVVHEPKRTLEKYRYLQENSSELMAMFMLGGGCFGGRFEERGVDGHACLNMDFSSVALPEKTRQEMIGVYGEGVRFQEAALADRYIAFTISDPDYGVADLIRAHKSGRTLEKNERIAAADAQLLPDAHIRLLADAGRVMEAVPGVVQKVVREVAARETPSARPMNRTTGPLVGWSCRVSETALDCRLAISTDDLSALLLHIDRLTSQREPGETAGSAPAPPLVWMP